MAKVLRIKEADLIAEFTARAEQRAFSRLSEDFNQEVRVRFQAVKGNIEDWQDPANEALLKARLGVLAAKPQLTEDNLKDMALISMLLYNIHEVP